MALAPILQYQGPALDLYGSFARGQQMGVLRRKEQREEEEYDRTQRDREQMRGILSQANGNYEEAASMLLGTGNIEAANQLLGMEARKQQGRVYDIQAGTAELELQKERQNLANERQFEQLTTEVSLANKAIQNLEGLEGDEQKRTALEEFFKSVDILNQKRVQQGLGPVEIPDDLRSGDINERIELLQGIRNVGQMRIEMINRVKALDETPTAEMKNFRFAQENPEFAEFLQQEEGLPGSSYMEDARILAADMGIPVSEAYRMTREGIGQGRFYTPEGGVQPLPGALETTTAEKKAEESGKVAGRGEITPKQKKKNAQGRVSQNLYEMADLYESLQEMGEIVDVDKPSFDNISASISASNLGQAVQRRMGTEAQSIRNTIGSIRPLLMNDIRQASEMGARGLDSEKELEFYLQAATDPQRDIQSNIAAIEILDKAYGLGLGIKNADDKKREDLVKEFKGSDDIGVKDMSDEEILKALE